MSLLACPARDVWFPERGQHVRRKAGAVVLDRDLGFGVGPVDRDLDLRSSELEGVLDQCPDGEQNFGAAGYNRFPGPVLRFDGDIEQDLVDEVRFGRLPDQRRERNLLERGAAKGLRPPR